MRVVQRYLGQLADFSSRGFAALNTALRRATAPTSTSRTASCSSSRCRSCSCRRRRVAGDEPPAHADRRSASAARRGSSRPTSARAACTYFTNAVTEVVRRRERGARPLQGAAGERRARSTSRSMHVHAAAQRQLLVALVLARRQAGPQRRHRHARRRRRRVHAERPVSRRRRPPGRQPHDHRSRQAALPEPRGLQGHPRRQGPRGVQRQDHRAPGRAEDRREADQPRAAALGRRARSTPSRSSRSSPTT